MWKSKRLAATKRTQYLGRCQRPGGAGALSRLFRASRSMYTGPLSGVGTGAGVGLGAEGAGAGTGAAATLLGMLSLVAVALVGVFSEDIGMAEENRVE